MDGFDAVEYNEYIEKMRQEEFPMLKDSLYLDHAGTTLPSKSLMERHHADMLANLYGNPHSASLSSQRSTQTIEIARMEALKYFNANPEHFDLIFTANTTAAIKLVMEAFREQNNGFGYGYHVDSHTSVIGVREVASEHHCLESDDAVATWLARQMSLRTSDRPSLLAYPAQSNMNGRRMSFKRTPNRRLFEGHRRVYTLLDAASFAATSPLDLSSMDEAPDFAVVSFAKIFGFPDLGALIVRKDTAPLFQRRRYFGGGTVDMVVCLKEQWHERKSRTLHEQLEDGTLPIHSILALRSAMQTHTELFGSLAKVAQHTTVLAKHLYDGLSALRHSNQKSLCTVYKHSGSTYGDPSSQGPIVAFNLQDSKGDWVSNAEVEKLASIKDIHIRTGGLCNPGGIARSLDLAPWEMRENFSAGHRCDSENDILNGKPTGVIRVSLGSMNVAKDVIRFIRFVDEFFVDHTAKSPPEPTFADNGLPNSSRFYVESLAVYPIKSCSGWQVPYDTSWDIRPEGLAWDREWCIVSEGTGIALSQKQHPRMALIRPQLDFTAGMLRITMSNTSNEISVPLSQDPSYFMPATSKACAASICGDTVQARVYTSPAIAAFFTTALGVPSTLARYSPSASTTQRHSKTHHRPTSTSPQLPILLSNESPILTISRSSLNRLNETIKAKGGKAASSSVFRANIILAQEAPGLEQPWAEDGWEMMSMGGNEFEFLGGCRRCQMVCVDPKSGERNQEPFVTLAKTRRFGGKVLFGVHTSLKGGRSVAARVRIGDAVETFGSSRSGR